jgi:hypothetical protein
MQLNSAEILRREQLSVELEQTLRAIDTLPVEERMLRLRELAARPRSQAKPVESTPCPSLLDKVAIKEREQKRRLQLKRLCRRFSLSRHTSAVLCDFIDSCLSQRSKSRLRMSASMGDLSPLQQIVWNVAPFFRHSQRTYATRAGHIAWEDLVEFLSLVQHSPKRGPDGRVSAKIVNRACRLRNEVNRLRVIYRGIHDEAPDTPYVSKIGNLLARRTRSYSSF